MTEKVFLDTNILLYAHDLDAEEKRAIADQVVRQLWADGTGILSTQVLYELYLKITTPTATLAMRREARDLVSAYRVWPVVAIDLVDILAASEAEERYGLSFRDAMVVVAALKARADILLTENVPSQPIPGLDIKNPFA
jgi:predicted nucleic acid-binding protein